MQCIWFWNTSYIIPNMDTIVCGGTAQEDDWNLTESIDDTKKIMGDICERFPSLIQAPVVCSESYEFQFTAMKSEFSDHLLNETTACTDLLSIPFLIKYCRIMCGWVYDQVECLFV